MENGPQEEADQLPYHPLTAASTLLFCLLITNNLPFIPVQKRGPFYP